ncbi:MAG TPA: hypothetical protein VIT45_06515 [Allosphingosinicella sp.]
MSRSLFQLSRAVARGRSPTPSPKSREQILCALLGMRAAAARAGLTDMESQLRSQIRWALPIRSPNVEPDQSSGAAENEGGAIAPGEESFE